jgi:hypothetical protein
MKINFIQSTDTAILGEYTTFKSKITLGRSLKNDIITRDTGLLPFHLYFEVSKEGIIVSGCDKSTSYSTNDKVFCGQKLHVIGDVIQVSKTVIEIKDFKLETMADLNLLARESYQEISRKYPEQESIIDEIEKELEHLESLKKSGVHK